MSPLGLLSEGETAEIIEMKSAIVIQCDSDKNHMCHAEDMGLRAGRMVEMLRNSGGGPLLLKIDESRIAIGRRMAMKIFVKRKMI